MSSVCRLSANPVAPLLASRARNTPSSDQGRWIGQKYGVGFAQVGKLQVFEQERQVNTLEHDDYLAMRAGAPVLEADSFGEKVLLLTDGTVLKLFRRKRLFSSAAWYPYAQRFADNAAALDRLGIPVPQIIDVVRIPSLARDAVHYHPLVGRTLREICREGIEKDQERELRTAFTRFVIHLHDCGVYFRSLHLGNVVYMPDQQLGLIDIADVRIRASGLSKRQRARNLRRLLGIVGECDWVEVSAIVDGKADSPIG